MKWETFQERTRLFHQASQSPRLQWREESSPNPSAEVSAISSHHQMVLSRRQMFLTLGRPHCISK